MPVPTVITDLSTTAASNYPAGTDSPSTLDDVQRAHASFIAQLRDGAGFSSGVLYGLKNRLINGNFGINQRGVSGTVTLAAGAYGHDRFKAGASGCTYTFATSANVTTLTISAGSLQQVVEGLNLETGTYTLSWTGTAQGKIAGGSYAASGVTGSITGGTDTTVEFNTGTLSKVQLQFGANATTFEQRPIGMELALCQRYYEVNAFTTYVSYTSGSVSNIFSGQWVVKKRVPPISLTLNGSVASLAIINVVSALDTVGWFAGVSGTGATGATHSATVIGSSEF